MKIVLDLKNKPRVNDIIIYDGKDWECINKDRFLNRVYELDNELKDTQKEIAKLKRDVNDRLKAYHNILQNLTKEE